MWCIQFEAKTNSCFKHVAQAIGNFENPPKAVAIHHHNNTLVATTLLIHFVIVVLLLGKVIVYCFTQPCFIMQDHPKLL